jgi:hypothetical protein
MKSYLFPLIENKNELKPCLYSHKYCTSSTFHWNGMTDPGRAPLESCMKHSIKRIVYFNIFLRFVWLLLEGLFNGLDDKLGNALINPEKFLGMLIFYYFLSTGIYAGIKEFHKTQEIPFLLKIAWWCYDLVLPGSFGILILYFTMRKRHYEMTDALYIVNVVSMGVDMFVGRMVLIPGHFPMYIGCVFFGGLFYKEHFGATTEQASVGFVVMLVCYLVLSTVTYARAQITGTNPIEYSKEDLSEVIEPVIPKIPEINNQEEEENLGGEFSSKISWFTNRR